MKEGYKKTIIIDALIQDMEKEEAEIVVADGIRMYEDVEPFRKKYEDDFFLVYVEADIKNRYERTKLRKQNDEEGEATFEQFLAEEKMPTEAAIHEIGQKADFKINNDGTLEELKTQVDEMMVKIIKK